MGNIQYTLPANNSNSEAHTFVQEELIQQYQNYGWQHCLKQGLKWIVLKRIYKKSISVVTVSDISCF